MVLVSKNAGIKDLTKGLDDRMAHTICTIFLLLVVLTWCVFTFNKFAVPSEGWYHVYAKMILNGSIPYRDFELCFPPLYTYLMTAVEFCAGDSLLAYRLVGVVILVSLVLTAYSMLSLVFPRWIAAVSAVVYFVTLISENGYISYDYIRFYDLFNLLSLYLLLRVLVGANPGKHLGVRSCMFLSGLLLSFSILVRQSSGVMMLAYCIVFLVVWYVLLKRHGCTRKDTGAYAAGILIPFAALLAWLLYYGIVDDFLAMTIFSGSKGSFADMFFNWLTRLFSYKSNVMEMVFGLCVCMGIILFMGRRTLTGQKNDGKWNLALFMTVALLSVASTVVLFTVCGWSTGFDRYWYSHVNTMFAFNFFLFVFLIVYVVYTVRHDGDVHPSTLGMLFLSGAAFVIQYGSGTSAGMSLGQGAINFALVFAFVMNALSAVRDRFGMITGKTLFGVGVVVFLCMSMSVRIEAPYQWWTLDEQSYWYADSTSDIAYFNGIVMTAEEKYVYEDFVEQCGVYLGEEDNLYCYSQVPLFYALADKMPVVRAPVVWFDVCRDQTAIDDLNYLKENNPKMIMFADHGDYPIDEHEKSFRGGETCGQRYIYNWLKDCRDNGTDGYTVLQTYHMDNYTFYLLLDTD